MVQWHTLNLIMHIINYGMIDNTQSIHNEGGTGIFDEDYQDILDKSLEQQLVDNTTVSGIESNTTNNSTIEINNVETISNIVDEVGASGGYVSKDFEDAGWEETGALVKKLSPILNINTISSYYAKGNNEEYEKWLRSLGGVFSRFGGKEKKGNGTGQDLINAGEYVYGLMGMLGFNYCAYTGGSDYDWTRCSPYMAGAYGGKYDAYINLIDASGQQRHNDINGHGPLHKLIDDCMVMHNFVTCCNYTVDKVYYKAGLMGGEGQLKSSCSYKSMIENYGGVPIFEVKDLHLGDIISCFEDNNNNSTNPDDWTGWWHVMYVGEESDDTVTIYETGHDYTDDGNWRREISKDSPRSAVGGGEWVGIHVWDLDYDGSKYVGYKGNEAVVSPVTGILLEYGTYEDEKDSLTGEEYRVNVDYKYGTDSAYDLIYGQETQTSNVQAEDIPIDKVGYAKILVLDKENYEKIESATNSKWKSDSLLTPSGAFVKDKLTNIDDMKNWSDLDKTIYAYKEFAQSYEEGGIAGNVIYIDGFKCNLQGTLNEDGTVSDDKEIDEEDYFESVTESNLSDKRLESLYERDDSYQAITEKLTERLKAESKIKEEASPSLYISDNDMIILKEGTVIGRTLTDKELLDNTEYRNGEYGTYKEIREDLESEVSVIGNYLRIIMRNENGDVVENVEDYMKLDGNNGVEQNDTTFEISGDYDIHDESYFVTINQFKEIFEGYNKIIDNADNFIAIQNKYKVNAVFAACVTIAESSGGNDWSEIPESSNNWFGLRKSDTEWKYYSNFADAIDDFGNYIANSSFYYKAGKYKVSRNRKNIS